MVLASAVLLIPGCATPQLPPVPKDSAKRVVSRTFGEIVSIQDRELIVNVGERDGLQEKMYCYIHRSDMLVGMAIVLKVGEAESVLEWTHQHDGLTPKQGDGTIWLR